jgi:hypothetical protein
LNKVSNTTVSTAISVKDTKSIVVSAVTGFVAGAFIVITDIASNKYCIAHQVGAIAGNTVALDRPLDFDFPAGSTVTAGSHDMSVDGSSTTQIFSLRAADPGLDLVIDVTRVLFQCTSRGAGDLTTFGDLDALTSGIVLRRVDRATGEYSNIFNAKTNGNMKGIMFDFEILASINPAQGADGFSGRLTFAGKNKMGSVIRLGLNQDLELLVQDDLAETNVGLLTFMCVAEGHVVEDS